jgi:hypothetical protein
MSDQGESDFFRKYLSNYNSSTKKGTCNFCNIQVQWSKRCIISHIHSSCSGVDEENRKYVEQINKRKLDETMFAQNISDSNNSKYIIVESSNDFEFIDEKIGDYYFRTGIALRTADSSGFIRMIRALNPLYADKVISAKRLAGTQLEKHSSKMKEKMNQVIKESSNFTLLSDGWTNVRGDHIVNFCIKAPNKKSIFYKSITTTGTIQNAETVAKAILDVIEEIGASKFCAAVTDNMNTMKAAWKIISDKYPHISAYGCSAHVLNLLIKDLKEDSDKIIQFINNHHIAKKIYDEKRAVCRVNKFQKVFPTRWFSLVQNAKSVLDAKYLLIDIIDNHHEELDNIEPKSKPNRKFDAFKRIVKSRAFWQNLSEMKNLIKYPSKIIGKLESEQANLSSVYYYFGKMYNLLEGNQKMRSLIFERLKFIWDDVIGLSYILTPIYAA